MDPMPNIRESEGTFEQDAADETHRHASASNQSSCYATSGNQCRFNKPSLKSDCKTVTGAIRARDRVGDGVREIPNTRVFTLQGERFRTISSTDQFLYLQ